MGGVASARKDILDPFLCILVPFCGPAFRAAFAIATAGRMIGRMANLIRLANLLALLGLLPSGAEFHA
jgi:hypothetical protein